MACSMKLDLESKVESAVHHLKMSMKWKEAGDPNYELGELRRMAQDVVDAWESLRQHEDQHRCNA